MVCCSSNAVGIMPVRNAKSVMSSVRLCRRTPIHNSNETSRARLPLGLPCSILPCSLRLTTTITESLPVLTLEPAVVYLKLKLHG
jgi:hypothetical protein